jgi:hypothetical protein
MSANTTTPTSHGMDCTRVAREEIAERYLVGDLSDGDRNAFEEHYFECARCFEELDALRPSRRSYGGPVLKTSPAADTRSFGGLPLQDWRPPSCSR